MRIISAVLLAAMCAFPASAKSYRISIGANVPVECELRTDGSLLEVAPDVYRIARVDQFCNTGFTLEVQHAALADPAVASFRGFQSAVESGSTTLISAGRPVNSGADLFLMTGSADDAMTFAQTMVLLVSPIGV